MTITDLSQKSPCAVVELRAKSPTAQHLLPAEAEVESDGIDYFEIIDRITWGKPAVAQET